MRRLALVLALIAGPAIANDQVPPPEYDIGDNTMTVDEVLEAYFDYFGTLPPGGKLPRPPDADEDEWEEY